MGEDAFGLIEKAARSGGSAAAFDVLEQALRKEKNYPLLFEARLMKKRQELGLPLISVDWSENLSEKSKRAYESTYIEAAREVGNLFLADGDIPSAWPYFRAIGETAPVAKAIESVELQDGIDPTIDIAFNERVHPRKGFELILAHYGMCRAITSFSQYPSRDGREDCLRLLVRELHQDLGEVLKRVIAEREGKQPETESISSLIKDRDWLFGEHSYHVDASHLAAVVRFSSELSDQETLRLSVELTDYGKRLAPMFQSQGQPPFENLYTDYGVYLRALLGEDVDQAVAYFCSKIDGLDPDEVGTAPAQVLVELLARLERYPEAVEVSLKHLRDVKPAELACPSVVQLCQLAGDPRRLMKISRDQSDLLSFTAALLQS